MLAGKEKLEMPLSRRDLVGFASTISLAASYPAASRAASEQNIIQALAFDAFPIFDPRRIAQVGFELYGDQGHNLASLWFPRIFNAMFISSAAGKYMEFGIIAQNSLRDTARSLKITPNRSEEDRLIGAFYKLPVWPDIVPALQTLKASQIKNMFLSNMPSDMLKSNIRSNNLERYFDTVVGSDTMKCYKPSPEAYRQAMMVFELPRDKIGFVAFGHWDAVGATWFGYKTAWINRNSSLPEGFDTQPQCVTNGIEGALRLVE